jgi:hypothetical protein
LHAEVMVGARLPLLHEAPDEVRNLIRGGIKRKMPGI